MPKVLKRKKDGIVVVGLYYSSTALWEMVDFIF